MVEIDKGQVAEKVHTSLDLEGNLREVVERIGVVAVALQQQRALEEAIGLSFSNFALIFTSF